MFCKFGSDDDSRPVLYRRDCGLPNLTCMLGAKIDNIYDVLEVLADAMNRSAVAAGTSPGPGGPPQAPGFAIRS
jgi:hypothetical protein